MRSEPSRASRARAAVGSPPGQCRQSNYPSPSPSSVTLFLSRCPRGLSPCHSRSLTHLLYLSVYPSLPRSPPSLVVAILSLSYPRSLAYDITRFSRGFLSLAHPSRLVSFCLSTSTCMLLYPDRSKLYPPKFCSLLPFLFIMHVRLLVRAAFNLMCL